MKLENQVVSLELAKKLKELGVEQDSLFYWCYEYRLDGKKYSDKRADLTYNKYNELTNTISYSKKEHISAYTVAELGEMLPLGYYTTRLFTDDNKKEEWIAILLPNSEYKGTGFRADTEADARAKMLIYLKENKLCA